MQQLCLPYLANKAFAEVHSLVESIFRPLAKTRSSVKYDNTIRSGLASDLWRAGRGEKGGFASAAFYVI